MPIYTNKCNKFINTQVRELSARVPVLSIFLILSQELVMLQATDLVLVLVSASKLTLMVVAVVMFMLMIVILEVSVAL